MTKEYDKSDQDISVHRGENFTIKLEANPTTGYEWEVLFDESIVRLTERRYISPAITELGAGGMESFRFEPIKAGDALVRMRYKRAWEQTPIEEKIFHLHIKASRS